MKLAGSKTEHDFRDELIKSNKLLFQDKSMERVLSVLKKYFSGMKTAYILYWTPEQGEDIITFLINTDIIAFIELDRHDHDVEPTVETTQIRQYRYGLSKCRQIKLEVAIGLAKKDISI